MADRDCRQKYSADQAAQDECWMAQALELAQGAARRTWPNPPVGALVVRDGEVVGRGAHQGAGTLHAEPVALSEAGDQAKGATLYVTLEPCNHQGRTAPCAPAVYASGVTRVVLANRDPNPTVIGGGCRHLRDRGVEVVCGVRAAEALEMIWPFVVTDNFSRPYVELKTAHSLDGFFAPLPSTRQEAAPVYLTGAEARLDVHRRRRRVDLVVVGKGTVAADRPVLDGRLANAMPDVPQAEPTAAYVDTNLSWSEGFRRDKYIVFAGASARAASTRAAIEADGGQIIFCGEKAGRVDPSDLVVQAAAAGYLSLMVEGGPTLAGSFLQSSAIDRWLRYQAPVILGAGVGWPKGFLTDGRIDRNFHLTSASPLGADLVTVHDRRKFSDVLARVTL
ncbi:MAG: bifunctional diaminohydroxyphosphoribosylaminopyrimidine deaminase/5-amino-6-(5-phosphoribosylamino)uracil reductase RibD [Candidatus Krumholzibacteria bacterium]|nr:bifunctional diaminohydroxyphosphoribosylaminopyrimidine deaminase/5-amino-6-(5-phosphoribosylamino)uracil reductase RibD [Candidatus Krumholzibacteria bacterium]